jgi:hypothetical protein
MHVLLVPMTFIESPRVIDTRRHRKYLKTVVYLDLGRVGKMYLKSVVAPENKRICTSARAMIEKTSALSQYTSQSSFLVRELWGSFHDDILQPNPTEYTLLIGRKPKLSPDCPAPVTLTLLG